MKKSTRLLSAWIECEGRIELGSDYLSRNIRIINEGGMVWEDNESETVNEALSRGEQYVKNEFEDNFGYKVDE